LHNCESDFENGSITLLLHGVFSITKWIQFANYPYLPSFRTNEMSETNSIFKKHKIKEECFFKNTFFEF
jgi:hypothetical protein